MVQSVSKKKEIQRKEAASAWCESSKPKGNKWIAVALQRYSVRAKERNRPRTRLTSLTCGVGGMRGDIETARYPSASLYMITQGCNILKKKACTFFFFQFRGWRQGHVHEIVNVCTRCQRGAFQAGRLNECTSIQQPSVCHS